jgi:IMP dehydrogenase
MATSNGTFASKAEIQDYTKALEVLEKDYPTRDGLDVEALLDSDKHGALTYNDFLILPGYIGAIYRKHKPCWLSLLTFP